MTLTVPQVLDWKSELLTNAGLQLKELVAALDSQRGGILQEQDALADSWNGESASAAAARVVDECFLVSSVADVVHAFADEFKTSGGIVEGVRTHVVGVVADAEARGFQVEPSGNVHANRIINLLHAMGTPSAENAALQVRIEATEMTLQLVAALKQAESAAVGVTSRLAPLIQCTQELSFAGSNGSIVDDGNGGYSWEPDYPATFASATIGVMTDVTGRGLTSAAVSSVDDVGRLIGKAFGPTGAVLGVVPAISNDIKAGMDPTKAIVTEGAAAAGGFAAGAYVGTWVGGVVGTFVPFPVVGTAVGVAVGAAVGGGVGWGGSKLLQFVWDRYE